MIGMLAASGIPLSAPAVSHPQKGIPPATLPAVNTSHPIQPRNVKQYSFAGAHGGSRRTAAQAEQYEDEFRYNLDLNDEEWRDLKDRIGNLIIAFITHHHVAIQWYEHAINRQRWWQRWFAALSAGLLLVIPIGLPILLTTLGGPKGSESALSNGNFAAMEIGAILSGIIGFQRAIASFVDKRSTLALFHRASAALKHQLFDFEDRWAGCVFHDVDAFVTSIRDQLRTARDIEDAEQQAYFDKLEAPPSLDVGSMLTAAASSATSLVSAFAPLSVRNVQRAGELKLRIEALRQKSQMLQENLERATLGQQAIIRNELTLTVQEIRAAEQELRAVSANQT